MMTAVYGNEFIAALMAPKHAPKATRRTGPWTTTTNYGCNDHLCNQPTVAGWLGECGGRAPSDTDGDDDLGTTDLDRADGAPPT